MDFQQHNTNGSSSGVDQKLALGLGWFSVGLGLWELLAPGSLARTIGVEDESGNRKLLRFYGMRELAAGVGILSQPHTSGWLWARVAGDALDMASLGKSLASGNSDKGKLTTAALAVAGVTALDVYCGRRMTQKPMWSGQPVHVRQSIVIGRSQEELYAFWKNLENLPSFMDHLDSVAVTGDKRSHWKAKGPAGAIVEWDAEITDDETNRLIAWRSLPGSDIRNSGTVRFERAAGGRGTLLRVELQWSPPAGKVSSVVAKLSGNDPKIQLDAALRALKQIMETGEVIRSDASIHKGTHPAQPPRRSETANLETGSGNLQPVHA